MKAVKKISGTAAVIENENIDTDQIIPAEHLKITNKSGLGKHLFSNWRYTADEQENAEFVLNKKETRQSKILIAGDNFGCGSSREHAPWALVDFGIEVVISSSIADIFRNNSIKNGLLPIVIDTESHQFLLSQNATEISVDIEAQTIEAGGKVFQFEIEPFARYCFLNGMDQLDFLISHQDKITTFENQQTRYE
ncbi:3-isopropylmalate dehydratase small subunit [Aliikangiella coralliicola]|uniref:3-isopropylmalate dehydratase small subunit n=1 Tax=Aliikangiella coralliicola TaxID=2592383 RepID=A0A545UK71_9GAMM|nr:3-isopropylmalate dehydratase small subunit [Aliikangiella coralliicola]TQV89843.1 3-isopropylmalate dehydratase small subunit [Aliikangiella coralliicola]